MYRIIISLILCAHLLLPAWVWAQATSRGPLDAPLKVYAVMLGAAILGGFVSWYGKVKRGEIPGYSMFHLIGELTTSSLAGLLCFWICEGLAVPQWYTAAATGLAGHMGARAIDTLERALAKRAQKALA
jgi:hypothetical protein